LVVESDFSRVTGNYYLTYTVYHPNVNDYSVTSEPINITIQNNCDQLDLNDYTTAPVIAYNAAPTFDLVQLTSSMLQASECIPMTQNSALKFKLHGM
jgi:PKD repeat protein